MSNLVIFDTSIIIDHLRTGHHQQRIESATRLIRTSSVVLAELWRGATKPAERKFLRALESNHPILTPTEKKLAGVGPGTRENLRGYKIRA